MDSKKYLTGLSPILLGILILTSCHHKKSEQEPVPRVEVASPIEESVILYREYPASLAAASSAKVVGRVNGLITAKLYRDGDYVQKGQKMFTIETTTYEQAVREAKARLSTARSQLSYATDRLEALTKGYKADAVSEMDVIQARNAKIQAQASVSEAEAELKNAMTNLSYCTVTAPISGKTAVGVLDVGGYVAGEGSPVVLNTIYDERVLAVLFNVEDSQFAQLEASGLDMSDPLMRRVPLNFKPALSKQYYTDINFTSPSVDTSTGTMLIKGVVDNPDGELRDGMYATLSLPCGRDPHGILVKDASIGTDQLGKYLYLVNDSDKVEYRHIETGTIYHDSLRLVTKGIKPGDRYVTKALLTVRQGMKVKPYMAQEKGKKSSSPQK